MRMKETVAARAGSPTAVALTTIRVDSPKAGDGAVAAGDVAVAAAGKGRRVGRPRGFDREVALSVAMDLFWRHGFEGTSTSQLTAAMGISPPSLYAAFGPKESLYREALALYGRRHGRFLSEPLAENLSAREAIVQVLQGAARQFSGAAHAAGCMVAYTDMSAAPDGAARVAEMAGLRQAAQRALQIRLEAAASAGELPDSADAATWAAYIAMVVQGMAVQARDGADQATLLRMADLALMSWPRA